MAKQISAPYIECSAQQSENSVRDIFHVATLACINKSGKGVKRGKTSRGAKRISHMPGRPDLAAVASDLRKDKAKSCSVMWLVMQQWMRLRLRTGTARAGSQPITHPEGDVVVLSSDQCPWYRNTLRNTRNTPNFVASLTPPNNARPESYQSAKRKPAASSRTWLIG